MKTQYKKIISSLTLEYFVCFILFVFFSILSFFSSFLADSIDHQKQIIFIAMPILLCISLIFLVLFIQYVPIYLQVKKINEDEQLNTIRIDVNNVSFKSIKTGRHSSRLALIVLICVVEGKKQKYYYILTDHISNYKKYKNKFFGKKKITIYRGSNIIKCFSKNIYSYFR